MAYFPSFKSSTKAATPNFIGAATSDATIRQQQKQQADALRQKNTLGGADLYLSGMDAAKRDPFTWDKLPAEQAPQTNITIGGEPTVGSAPPTGGEPLAGSAPPTGGGLPTSVPPAGGAPATDATAQALRSGEGLGDVLGIGGGGGGAPLPTGGIPNALPEVASEVGGDIAGQIGGDIAGQVGGDVAGQVAGDVAGQVAGDVAGQVAGDVALQQGTNLAANTGLSSVMGAAGTAMPWLGAAMALYSLLS